jgi:four helix bundle protein
MARRFEDLVCWQLANELSCEVFALTSKEPTSRDFKFCDQIRDSAASAPRNISEGFGRYKPGPFAQYLGWARASLMETKSSLIEARQRKYVSDALGSRLSNLAAAAIRVTTKLMLEKQREAARQPKPKRPEKPSFSITLEELEAKRK